MTTQLSLFPNEVPHQIIPEDSITNKQNIKGESDWQSMDTAPKDEFILIKGVDGDKHIGGYSERGWFKKGSYSDEDDCYIDNPIGWMPLPE